MDNLAFKQKISKIIFFIDDLKYRREKHLYFVLFIIIFFLSMAILGVYFYQKNEISKKESILRSYFEETSLVGIDTSISNVSPIAKDLKDVNLKEDNTIIDSSIAKENLEGSDEATSIKQDQKLIKVYICGCVKNSGVYEVSNESRISDLAEMCGGFTEEACLEAVNLARKLNDSDRIYIPSKTEVSKQGISLIDVNIAGNSSNGITGEVVSQAIKTININSSNIEELKMLPGVGEQIAKNIIDYRNQFGLFKFKEDLKNVKGIGEKKYEQMKDLISI